MYGYQDSSAVGPGKQGGKFGLNQGAFVSKFEFNPNAGAGGAVGEAIDLNVSVGEKEYMLRFFPVSKVYAKKGGGEIVDVNSEEYKEGHKEAMTMLSATLSDVVKCFVSEEDLKLALAIPINSFKEYATILQRLVQTVPNWSKIPVDIFLEYQFKPSGENTRTFLTLPNNVKHGSFITRSLGLGFNEERTATSLKYTREGEVHPLKRGEWFLGSAFSNQIDLGGDQPASNPMQQGATATATNW
jgi:hypothetical protein